MTTTRIIYGFSRDRIQLLSYTQELAVVAPWIDDILDHCFEYSGEKCLNGRSWSSRFSHVRFEISIAAPMYVFNIG